MPVSNSGREALLRRFKKILPQIPFEDTWLADDPYFWVVGKPHLLLTHFYGSKKRAKKEKEEKRGHEGT